MRLWTVLTDAYQNAVAALRTANGGNDDSDKEFTKPDGLLSRTDPESQDDAPVPGNENDAVNATTLVMMATPGSHEEDSAHREEPDGKARGHEEEQEPHLDSVDAEASLVRASMTDDHTVSDPVGHGTVQVTPSMLIEKHSFHGYGQAGHTEGVPGQHSGAVVIAFPSGSGGEGETIQSHPAHPAGIHGREAPHFTQHHAENSASVTKTVDEPASPTPLLDLRADLLAAANGQDEEAKAVYLAYVEKILGMENPAKIAQAGELHLPIDHEGAELPQAREHYIPPPHDYDV